MKKAIGTTLVMLILVIGGGLRAQSNQRYSTVVIEYLGENDRLIFPVTISDSKAEAEWYRQKLFSDPTSTLMRVSTFVHVYVVKGSTMKEIADIPLLRSSLPQPRSIQRPVTAPTLRLVLATGQSYREVRVDARQSIDILDRLKKITPENPELADDMGRIEVHMNEYLKRSH